MAETEIKSINGKTIADVSARNNKLDKNQGAENAGKILGIGVDGNVVPQKPVQALAGDTAPTTATSGVVGQEYYVIVNNAVTEMYVCTSALIGSYTWDKVEFGGACMDVTGAKVGQIAKITAVDSAGKPTAWEPVDMPTQKSLKWITVYSSDLTDETTEIVISTDSNGKTIASYNPVGLTLVLSTPADSTQTDNNGAPWVYPSATKADNVIRVIGLIAGWKKTARDNVFAFYGGSSAMTCTGNQNTQLATYKIDGYLLDGVKAMLNGNANHFPVGTHVEVAILCEV